MYELDLSYLGLNGKKALANAEAPTLTAKALERGKGVSFTAGISISAPDKSFIFLFELSFTFSFEPILFSELLSSFFPQLALNVTRKHININVNTFFNFIYIFPFILKKSPFYCCKNPFQLFEILPQKYLIYYFQKLHQQSSRKYNRYLAALMYNPKFQKHCLKNECS